MEKVDLTTLDLLVKATDLMDSETMNLEQTHENSAITLCVWGNLVKNPRFHVDHNKIPVQLFIFLLP